MKAIAGAALAVVMGCVGVGSVGSAEAATLYNAVFELDVPISIHAINYSTYEFYQDSGSYSHFFNLNSISDTFSLFTDGFYISGSFNQDTATVSAFGFANVDLYGDVPYSGLVSISTSAYLTGTLGDPSNVFATSILTAEVSFGASGLYFEDPQFQGAAYLTVVQAPLPASAPMFGAALLALGGLAYARRRGMPITTQA